MHCPLHMRNCLHVSIINHTTGKVCNTVKKQIYLFQISFLAGQILMCSFTIHLDWEELFLRLRDVKYLINCSKQSFFKISQSKTMNRSERCMNLKRNIILARTDLNVSKTRLKPAEGNHVVDSI